ncbi:MAG: dTDP-4-dehydrorhamnose reductase [Acidobacteria bacterium]|jgi:dTDP-4-dehydrorhamnose reductase|nr:dTDP-4-dehydrorhamnose reductase [Acidobacteriota bacterium]
MRRTVLVTGAAGQLAQAIIQTFGPDHEVVALTRAELDITDESAVEAVIAARAPAIVINCASENDVDRAQTHAVRALEINAFGVRALARAVERLPATLVHYSTDFVFDGSTTRPYVEDDRTNPQSVYSASKLLGEWFALEATRGFVLRVESLFGAPPAGRPARSSLDRIVSGIEAGDEVPVFSDRTVSPSYVHDIAAATRRLLEMQAPAGVYHCVNTGACSWVDVAREAGRLLGMTPRLRPITLEDVALRAPRPKFCALDNSRLTGLGIVMPTWQDALARHIRARRS